MRDLSLQNLYFYWLFGEADACKLTLCGTWASPVTALLGPEVHTLSDASVLLAPRGGSLLADDLCM